MDQMPIPARHLHFCVVPPRQCLTSWLLLQFAVNPAAIASEGFVIQCGVSRHLALASSCLCHLRVPALQRKVAALIN